MTSQRWTDLEQVRTEASVCVLCPLLLDRCHVVFGVGDPHAALMIVGEAPGVHEDETGEPFVGPTRSWLDDRLHEIGLSRGAVYITNAVKCHPPGVPPHPNRAPLARELRNCADYLDAQVAFVGPKVIVAIGGKAASAVLGEPVTVAGTREHSWPRGSASVVVTWHPSGFRYGHDRAAQAQAGFKLAAAALTEAGA